MGKKTQKLKGTVEKIVEPMVQGLPEKAQISIVEGEDLYREIRVENVVTSASGEKAGLKLGAEVDVIVEADSSATIKKLKTD
jgi:molybdopterin-binding protein